MLPEDGPWRAFGVLLAGVLLCGALVSGGFMWRDALREAQGPATETALLSGGSATPTQYHPLIELLKLVSAALMGLLVTTVHMRCHRDKPLPRSLAHAQILLCVAGALMMIIIGNSLARAFGVAGAAGIVRFRTPVEDPKDTTVIFMLLGLGLSCGLGAFAVAGLGTAFLCVFLLLLDRFGEVRQRTILLSLVAPGREFPTEHVHNVLRAVADFYEPREVQQGNEAVVRYQVSLDPSASLTWLSQQLLADGKLKAVSWGDPPKDKKA